MRRIVGILLFIALASLSVVAQTPTPKAGHPTAIIDTTKGTITCELFPDKAPITVANFIGLATGTKDRINPASKVKKHGVPLYDGTVFHRVIPDFMIRAATRWEMEPAMPDIPSRTNSAIFGSTCQDA